MLKPRLAQVDDAARLAALAQWVWLDSYAPDGVEHRFLSYLAESFTPQVFEGLLRDAGRQIWLMEEGAALQGFVQLCRPAPAPVDRADRPQVELERLYVAPPCTGRGLGPRLLGAARAVWPREALWLSAWAGNEGALRFYRREGGEEIGETDFFLDGQPHRNLVLAWPAAMIST